MTRLIVTGNDKENNSYIVSDGDVVNVAKPIPGVDLSLTNIWALKHSEPLTIDQQRLDGPFPLEPKPGETIMRIVNFPPDKHYISAITPELAEQMWAAIGKTQGINIEKHPMMHTTMTVDLAVVLSGSVTLLLDNEESVMHAGDTLVQRATSHAWINHTDEMASILFILVSAE